MSKSDPFQWDTGLLDDVDVTVLKPWFEHDEEYQDGDPLVLKLQVDVEGDDYDEPYDLMFSCGESFTTKDSGKTAERVDGTDRNFNQKSSVVIMLDSILATDEGRKVLVERYENDGITPQHAAMYDRLKFHLGRIDVDYGGDIGVLPRMICETFLGVAGEDGSGAAKAKAKPAAAAKKGAAKAKPKAKAKAEPEPEAEAPALDDETDKVLSDLADECTTHDEFMERAMAEYELSSEAEEGIQSDADDSIWGRSVARASEG